MKLGKDLLKLLSQTYAADTLIERQVGKHSLAFQTDRLDEVNQFALAWAKDQH